MAGIRQVETESLSKGVGYYIALSTMLSFSCTNALLLLPFLITFISWRCTVH